MNTELIGIWAGVVYKALDASETKTLSLKLVKKLTKLKKDELMTALGWLARENKIEFNETDTDIDITLI